MWDHYSFRPGGYRGNGEYRSANNDGVSGRFLCRVQIRPNANELRLMGYWSIEGDSDSEHFEITAANLVRPSSIARLHIEGWGIGELNGALISCKSGYLLHATKKDGSVQVSFHWDELGSQDQYQIDGVILLANSKARLHFTALIGYQD